MLQFDDSCYIDAKQYHLASFSTRNSTLNTSLRKPIRMQDFIQLCDSNKYPFSTVSNNKESHKLIISLDGYYKIIYTDFYYGEFISYYNRVSI